MRTSQGFRANGHHSGADNGWWQRGWLLVNTGWLTLTVLTAARPGPSGRR